MAQLAGQTCVRCATRISGDFNSLFCPECGNPIHEKCLAVTPPAVGAGHCPKCGGRAEAPIAAAVRAERMQKDRKPSDEAVIPAPLQIPLPDSSPIPHQESKPSRTPFEVYLVLVMAFLAFQSFTSESQTQVRRVATQLVCGVGSIVLILLHLYRRNRDRLPPGE